MSNECLDAAVAELNAVGITPDIMHGGKHIQIRWQIGGRDRMYVTAASPSDRRAHLNVRADMRRMLRKDGLLSDNEIATVEQPSVALRAGEACVSSLDVARHFGKAHKDVLRSIDAILGQTGSEFGERNFAPSSYITEQSKKLRCFDLTRDGFSLLVMGFTGAESMQWKLRYIEAFNAMEAELMASRAPLERRLAAMEGDLQALTSLFMDECAPPKLLRSAGFIRIKPSIRNKWLAMESAV